jgi:hypothetical protein
MTKHQEMLLIPILKQHLLERHLQRSRHMLRKKHLSRRPLPDTEQNLEIIEPDQHTGQRIQKRSARRGFGHLAGSFSFLELSTFSNRRGFLSDFQRLNS